MTKLEPRHYKALRKAYELALDDNDHLQARYLREVLNKFVPPQTTKVVKTKTTTSKREKRQEATAVFMRPLQLSPQLQAICGKNPIPRTEVVSKLWAYIKKHKLQDQENKRMVHCDAKLIAIFGKKEISMFDMAGLIAHHVK